jgi:hypothetical protein
VKVFIQSAIFVMFSITTVFITPVSSLPKLNYSVTIVYRSSITDTPGMKFPPSKYFEVRSNELVFYRWAYKDFTNNKGEKENKHVPIFKNGAQVELNPSEANFLADVAELPAIGCKYDSTVKQSFELLVKDNYNYFKRPPDENRLYYMEQLYVDQPDFEQFAGMYVGKESKLFSDDVVLITASYEVSRWKKVGDKFVLTKVEALNPDLLDKNDQATLESLYLFRYCRYPWSNNVNFNNKSFGFLNCKVGDKIAYSNGHKIELPRVPVIKDSKMIHPLSSLSEELNFNVQTKGSMLHFHRNRKTSDGKDSEFSINTKNWTISKDGKTIEILPRPYYIDKELMVPVRTICEFVDAGVLWRGCDRSVLIERF